MVAPSVRQIITSGPSPGVDATAFLARTTGLTTKERNAYINLINRLVAAGFWTRFDALWILATGQSANANLNLVSTNFPLTPTNSPTFTANVGYTGNGSNARLATAYTPSTNGVNFTQNSAAMGAYINNNRTSSNSSVIMGTGVPSSFAYIVPLETSNFKYDMNSATFPTVANGGTAGLWTATRTAASGAGATAAYKNDSPSAITTTSATSAARSSFVLQLLCLNNNGTLGNFTSDTLSAAFVMNGLTGAESAQLATIINRYMREIGANVF